MQSKKEKNLTSDGIFNLSSVTLSDPEKSLLNKGLKFAPPRGLDKFQTYIDIHKFVRRVNIKRYMASNPISNTGTSSKEYRHSGLSKLPSLTPLVLWPPP